MSATDNWAADWACDKLISHDQILKVEHVEDHLVQMNVKDYAQDVLVAIMSERKVTLANIPNVCRSSRIDFLLNIPKNAYFDGDLLSFAENTPFGVGGLGDLYTAVNEKEFLCYLPKEVRFILRGLRQHTAVSSVSRDNNRLYIIGRFGKNPFRVLALNEYDLTADAIRSGIDLYGHCDFVLASNPNCRLSSAAQEAARSAGTGVLKWRQLLGVINSA